MESFRPRNAACPVHIIRELASAHDMPSPGMPGAPRMPERCSPTHPRRSQRSAAPASVCTWLGLGLELSGVCYHAHDAGSARRPPLGI